MKVMKLRGLELVKEAFEILAKVWIRDMLGPLRILALLGVWKAGDKYDLEV